jgi:hypothetical protein
VLEYGENRLIETDVQEFCWVLNSLKNSCNINPNN